MTCSAPADCAEIERRRATGIGLLVDGGASRGNLLSGEADEVILTVSRMEAEKKANPGYRAFFANGYNVTRALVLFVWEVLLEWTAALRAIRRDVQPRGHRGGIYPFMRGAMCVVVRDLIVYGVLSDMMRGRPAVYATFSSYDEVAHHSGLERADTLEALRKLDEQFGTHRAGPPATRRGRTRSSSSPTTGRPRAPRSSSGTATRSRTSSSARSPAGDVPGSRAATSSTPWSGTPSRRRPAGSRAEEGEERRLRPGRGRARLGQPRARLPDGGAAPADPRGDRRAPSALLPALRAHPHVGWLLVRSSEQARSRSAPAERTTSPTAASRATTRLRRSRRPRRSTSCAPTASSTSPTS